MPKLFTIHPDARARIDMLREHLTPGNQQSGAKPAGAQGAEAQDVTAEEVVQQASCADQRT